MDAYLDFTGLTLRGKPKLVKFGDGKPEGKNRDFFLEMRNWEIWAVLQRPHEDKKAATSQDCWALASLPSSTALTQTGRRARNAADNVPSTPANLGVLVVHVLDLCMNTHGGEAFLLCQGTSVFVIPKATVTIIFTLYFGTRCVRLPQKCCVVEKTLSYKLLSVRQFVVERPVSLVRVVQCYRMSWFFCNWWC